MYKFKNFSESGNKVISSAVKIAGKMGHITVGTEHLLLGILSSGKSDVVDLMTEFGINFVCVYDVVVNIMGSGVSAFLTTDDISNNAVNVLKTAYAKALRHGRNCAGANEILYSITINNSCMAYQILNVMLKDSGKFYCRSEKLCDNNGLPANGAYMKKELKNLEKYAKNLTEAAKVTPFDPCIGRDGEINQLIEILLRRRKNNPCLVGFAGVGKTAIVEGLANLIASGQVPPEMKNKSIYAVDMAYLLAGTKYRGDFEERVKAVLEEACDRDIILFIDEIHIIASAGGAEGAIDAANILKPALARGQVQVIGATTKEEYSRVIEKDSALERRFSVVQVLEPTCVQAENILLGLKEKYSSYHRLEISDDVIKKCVELSVRYINHRYLPDKAIDVLDQTCAFAKIQGKVTVKEDDVEDVISRKTGIDITKLKQNRRERYSSLEKRLSKSIIGQEEAVRTIAHTLKRWRAGLKDETKPIASFLFTGPTGVGKTYSCKVLSDVLFGSEQAVVRIDCTEYSEKNDVAKLIGSPPGYVGYDDGGRLEREMSEKGRNIILFDEIEKAHTDLYNLLLQAMDNGFITTSKGKKLNFRNSIIIMTSNLGTQAAEKADLGFNTADIVNKEKVREKTIAAVQSVFPPEFMGRLDRVVAFNALTGENMLAIAKMCIDVIAQKLKKQKIYIDISDTVLTFICERCTNSKYGARGIKSAVSEYIEDKISDMIISDVLHSGQNAMLTVGNEKIEVKICENSM